MRASPKVPDAAARDIVDPRAYGSWSRIHDTFSELRRELPLGVVELEGYDRFWAVTRHADIQAVSLQNDRFHNNGNRAVLSSRSVQAVQAAKAAAGAPPRATTATCPRARSSTPAPARGCSRR